MQKILLFFTIVLCSNIIPAQVTKSVHLEIAGKLSDCFSMTDKVITKHLTITGEIDARDFAFMRDEIKNLSEIDLSGTTIKAYNGTAGGFSGIDTNYADDEIPHYAFYNPILLSYKPSLETIILPDNTKSIGYLAFYFCWNLSSIEIPETVTSIADYTFYGCYALESINVANSNTKYSSESGVLFNKLRDTLLICPNAKSGDYTIPTGVKQIANSAFENCYSLSSIKFPNSLKSIGAYAFASCSGIYENLTLPNNLSSIGDGAFYGCYNLYGTISIPANLTELGSSCFLGCNYLKSFEVNIANTRFASVNEVLYSKNLDTLFVCPSGKSGYFTIPNSVKLIGSYAFYNCSGLTGTMTIPQYTDYIGYYAFYGCDGIHEFMVHNNNPYFMSDQGILYSKSKNRLISCPAKTVGSLVLPKNLESIDPGACSNCVHLTDNIHFPATFEYLGEYAFYNCPKISGFTVSADNAYFSADKGVLLNKNQEYLYLCPLSKTGSYTLPPTVKYIGYSSFSSCEHLTQITLPPSVEEIGASAFEFCTGLYDLHIPQKVNFIGSGAFYACSNLKEISIAQNSPPIVDYYTFEFVDKATCTLTVPTGAQTCYKNAPYWEEFINISETQFNTAESKIANQNYQLKKLHSKLIIDNLQNGAMIRVYNLQGICVFSQQVRDSHIELSLNKNELFVVKINQFTEKIIL